MAQYSLRKMTIGGGTSSSDHPFKVTMRNHPTAENRYQALVNVNSSLMKSLKPDDRQIITGLDEWFELITTDVIWLGIVFTPGTTTITSASIDSYGLGDSFDPTAAAWSANNSYCEGDGTAENEHQTSRVMIAYTFPGDDGSPTLHQTCYTHLVLQNMCIDLKAATFPMPSPYGPYVAV